MSSITSQAAEFAVAADFVAALVGDRHRLAAALGERVVDADQLYWSSGHDIFAVPLAP